MGVEESSWAPGKRLTTPTGHALPAARRAKTN